MKDLTPLFFSFSLTPFFYFMFQTKHRRYSNNSFRSVAISFFIFMFTSNSNANQQSQICSEIHKLLILKQQGRVPVDFVVESLEHGGGDDIYPKLDIDGDGIDDSIVRSCGASIDALCSLFVKLSTGEQLELEEERFFLARVKSNIYVVLGESLSQPEMAKSGKRRAFQNQTGSADFANNNVGIHLLDSPAPIRSTMAINVPHYLQ